MSRCISHGNLIIASAIIWAAVILASAVLVPAEFAKLIPILGGGAAGHIIILGGAAQALKRNS